MRRVVVLVALLIILTAAPVSAEVPNHRKDHADAHCARMAERFARDGFTARELARLAAEPCREDGGVWHSALVWTQ